MFKDNNACILNLQVIYLFIKEFLLIIITMNFIKNDILIVNVKSHTVKEKEDVHCAPSLFK